MMQYIHIPYNNMEWVEVPKVIMVDQLWMWILDKNTILTSFPQRYGEDRQNASGVHKSIRRRLEQAKSNQIRSVFDLALVILDECANDVFNQEAAQDPKPPIIDIFSRSIGDLAHRQKLSRDGLRELTASASLLHKSTPQKARRIVQQLTRVNFEGLFLDDITKIVDELNIMINNSRQHRDIIGKFIQHAENILNPEGLLKDEKSRAFDTADSIASPSENGKFSTSSTETRLAIDQFFWFQRQAGDLLIRVDNRITELLGLLNRAEKTSKAINELHTLILQQASVLQAWQAGEEVGESLQHGRSIMVFTIVTIIFLPLSFMSSVFGMNNSNIGDNQMSFREQANYMFPISAGVILISIIFAFWRFPRTIFWSAYKVTETWLLVNTGLYGLWLYLVEKSQFFKIDVLLNKLEQNIEEMKEESIMARFAVLAVALYAALAQAAPAQTNCSVQIQDSAGGGTAAACSEANVSAGVTLVNGPHVQYTLSPTCELTITNGPFDSVTATASVKNGAC
ncbi:hypothetical protein CkaCkLH20_11353 [Colletotrichum karsti]|uniref:Magnesium transport protein CorA n=1 Tax=Colletotrichum karsti TaxID=1095194 RepID=A0A9P6LD94_9PEZI|nr:uncharacterized protein CkaCkLH20_11353 [Colletotrichum karsti]KAF9871184.1 hypothetical protein CkaCkLH20_11353 [Colletotrichum karsti]